MSRGQLLAKIEDCEIVEQVKQAEASLEVAQATIRQREADLKVAELNFERSKNLFGRQLLAKQALDDAESRYLAAQAQLDLSKAQSTQTERAPRRAANQPGQHPDHLAGRRLRRQAQRRSRRLGVAERRRWSRWSTSRACGSWPTSSRRICGW